MNIVTDYGLEDRVSISGKGKIFFSTVKCPGRLCGTLSLISNV
jgi:hypothetical protein